MKKFLLLFLCCCSNVVSSETAGELLHKQLNAMATMTAHFNQVVNVKKKAVSRSSGTMALHRPGRFRWKTTDPMEQLIVADGQKIWIYDVALEQVTVKKQERNLGGTAALFLSGYDGEITKDFEVTRRDLGKNTLFDLKAKATKENFQRIKLQFNQDQLTQLTLYDQLGQTTYVTLSAIKINRKISAKLFQFTPPQGVDVVKQ